MCSALAVLDIDVDFYFLFSHLIARFSVCICFSIYNIGMATMSKQGGVGLRIRVYDRIMCFVNCHLAAHLEAVNRRNADFDHIYRNMVFSRSSSLLNAAGMVPYLFFVLLSCLLHIFILAALFFWLAIGPLCCSWCLNFCSYASGCKCMPFL